MSDLAAAVSESIREAGGAGSKRVLCLGRSDRVPPAVRRDCADRATADEAARAHAPGSFDLVFSMGELASAEWDRWSLQQIHRLLRPGGDLVLVAPNMLGIASPADLPHVAEMVLKQVRKAAARIIRRGMPSPKSRSRRFLAARLLAMLESVGFEIVSLRPAEPGVWSVLGRVGPGLASRFSRQLVVHARRLSALHGVGGRPFPEHVRHRLEYERANATMIRRRDAWVARNAPSWRPGAAQAFRPEDYDGARVVVLAPHPDDEIIGCGGTLRRLIGAGARVTIVHATDGADSAALQGWPMDARRTVRLREAEDVARSLGAHEVVFWKEDNIAFRFHPRMVDRLAEVLRQGPRLIFAPFVADLHPDHVTLDRVLAAALPSAELPADARVLGYEVWSLVPADTCCDVTDLMPTIEELLLRYETAMKVDDFVRFCADRNYYNAVVHRHRQGYDEAFHTVTARDYPALLGTI